MRDRLSIHADPSADWLKAGEKYALISMRVPLEDGIVLPLTELAKHHWVMADAKLPLPLQWQEWLGSIRADQMEECNLFLLSKVQSTNPDIIDQENIWLSERVQNFYRCLLLSSHFSSANPPVQISGAFINGAIEVRSFVHLVPSVEHPVFYSPVVTYSVLAEAANLAASLDAIATEPKRDRWRLNRVMALYSSARSIVDFLERIHQYCRCIEGLILPEQGKTKKQFQSRTQLFIGSSFSNILGDIYDARSAAEHLNEYRYLAKPDRKIRIELMRYVLISEFIVRNCLKRIIFQPHIRAHFESVSTLEAFWRLPQADQAQIWGCPLDVSDALMGFDESRVPDRDLGLA